MGRPVDRGMTMREALEAIKSLGLPIRIARRTGEYVIGHPDDRIRTNCRRRDASRALVGLLRREVKRQGMVASQTINQDAGERSSEPCLDRAIRLSPSSLRGESGLGAVTTQVHTLPRPVSKEDR